MATGIVKIYNISPKTALYNTIRNHLQRLGFGQVKPGKFIHQGYKAENKALVEELKAEYEAEQEAVEVPNTDEVPDLPESESYGDS